MYELRYKWNKIKSKISPKKKEVLCEYFRKYGMKIGKNVNICSNILTGEAYLVEIGDDVTIAGDVLLITHDNSISKVLKDKTDLFGKISIGKNCFIGAGSIIMYGCSLADSIIVASGSVVTHSFSESRIIIGGNPARKIGTCDEFVKKSRDKALNITGLSTSEKQKIETNPKYLVTR